MRLMSFRWLLPVGIGVVAISAAFWLFAEKHETDDILSQLREIPSATLADAVDQVVGKRGFMDYDMRPVSETPRMVGRAKTVLYGPVAEDTKEKNTGPLYGVQIIDESGPGEVMVAVTGDRNITGIGGLMTLTAQVRGLAGAVIDGAARDVDQIRALGFSVFSRSICPSTMVNRQASIARDVPVVCAGITVYPGDYIVGDTDGVVCIPAARIKEVVARAQEMEEAEKKMIPMIQEIKSLRKVVEMFRRI